LPQLRSLTVYPFSQLQQLSNYSESTSTVNALISQIKRQSPGRQVEYALDLHLWDQINEVEVELLASRQDSARIVFLDITRVILFPHYCDPTTLCLWLKLLFPRLKTLVFTCQIAAQPDQVSLLEAEVVEELIEELATTCPAVETLVVANETYKLGKNS